MRFNCISILKHFPTRIAWASLAVMFAMFIASSEAIAQQALNDDQRATIAFDLRVDMAMASELAQKLNLKEEVSGNMSDDAEEQEMFDNVTRVFGAISLPDNVAAFEEMFMGAVMDEPKMEATDGDWEAEPFDPAEMDDDGFGDGGLGDGFKAVDDGTSQKVSYQQEDMKEDFTAEDLAELERMEMQEMQDMEGFEFEPPTLPVDFFVQIKFADAPMADRMFTKMREDFEEEVEAGGKIFFKSPFAPANVRIHMPDENTIEVGTELFLVQPDRKLFTANLTETWKKVPNQAARIAIDVDGTRSLINSAREMVGADLPPQAKAFVDLVDSVSSVRIGADLSGAQLLQVVASGTTGGNVDDLRSGLDALLGLAKFAGKNGLNMVGGEMPEAVPVASQILDSLTATKEGSEVFITIPKPDGFDDTMVVVLNKMKEQAAEAAELNRIREVCLSVHNYNDAYGRTPFTYENGESEDLSWRARVTMFLFEYIEAEFDFEKGWDDPANQKFAALSTEAFGADGMTDICRVAGDPPKNIFDVQMTSEKIMLLQNPVKVEWTMNKDITIEEAVAAFNALPEGEGLIAAMYDGSVRRIRKSEVSEDEFRKMLDWKSE